MNSVRKEMADWAGAEAVKEAKNYRQKVEGLQNKLAVALCSAEEAEAREIQ